MHLSDVFISYSHDDRPIARRFAEALTAEGFSVWWDAALRSGDPFDEVIEQTLRQARAIVVLWSPRSVASRWVRAEATIADRNRALIPAMIEACERPIMFELTHTVDLSAWAGDPDDPTWREFLRDVRALVEAGPARPDRETRPAESRAPKPSRHRKPSLAVLPFTNRSGLPEDEVFASGMVEDLVSALSFNRALKVIASSATQSYRRGATDMRAVGRELGARYVLEGNVRRVGADLRVTSQLVEAESGEILWTERFDRPLSELAALQEDLVMDVAANLGVEVERIETEKALRKPSDLTAWEAVVRSMNAYHRIGSTSPAAAVEEARKAIAIDPEYAVAHSALALALATFQGWLMEDEALLEEITSHASRALYLGGSNPSVLWAVSWAYCLIRRPEQAVESARRAVELNPNMALAQLALGNAHYFLNQPQQALPALDASERLAPRGAVVYLSSSLRSMCLFQLGQLEAALAESDRAMRLNPHYPATLLRRMTIAAKLGRDEQVLDAVRRIHRAEPSLSFARQVRRLRMFVVPAPDDGQVAAFSEAWAAVTGPPGAT